MRKLLFIPAVLLVALAYVAYRSQDDSITQPRRNLQSEAIAVSPSTGQSSPAVATNVPRIRDNIGGKKSSTPGSEILRLSLTGDPDDAMRAYQLAASCAIAQNDNRLLASIPLSSRPSDFARQNQLAEDNIQVNCEGIDPQLLQRRFDNLAIAAKAGVVGASTALLQEGPFGDPTALETRPDDLGVRNWKVQVLESLVSTARSGEISNFGVLSTIYQNGTLGEKNMRLSLTYQLAEIEAMRFNGLDPVRQESLVTVLRNSLTKEEIERAKEEALLLVKK